MSAEEISLVSTSVLPGSAIVESRHLLSEREATKVVLGNMLAELEACSQQAAVLDSLYSGLVTSPGEEERQALQALVQEDQAAVELAGLHALIEQKKQQLHELKQASNGVPSADLYPLISTQHCEPKYPALSCNF